MHIIMKLSQPVIGLTSLYCMLSRKAANTNFIIFGLTRPEFTPRIYHNRGKHTNITPPRPLQTYIDILLKSNTLYSIWANQFSVSFIVHNASC